MFTLTPTLRTLCEWWLKFYKGLLVSALSVLALLGSQGCKQVGNGLSK